MTAVVCRVSILLTFNDRFVWLSYIKLISKLRSHVDNHLLSGVIVLTVVHTYLFSGVIVLAVVHTYLLSGVIVLAVVTLTIHVSFASLMTPVEDSNTYRIKARMMK